MAVASIVAVMLMSVTALVGGAGSAAAEPGDSCPGHEVVSASMKGQTENRTALPLRRTYLEYLQKGLPHTWGQEPSETVKAHGNDGWCAYADVYRTLVKVVYEFGDSSHVTFESWRYREGPAGSRCSVDGPDAAAYRCVTRVVDPRARRTTVFFTLEPIR